MMQNRAQHRIAAEDDLNTSYTAPEPHSYYLLARGILHALIAATPDAVETAAEQLAQEQAATEAKKREELGW